MPAKITWTLPHAPSRENLHHHIAARIGRLIAQGSLPPGTVLPNEAVLGSELAVSRTALREAIKVLSAKGLVEVRRKTGTRVRPRGEWHMLDPEVLTWFFAGDAPADALADLVDMRKGIEPRAARLAAIEATVQDLMEIQLAFAAMEAAAGDLPAAIDADLRFHLAILEASHNIFMRSFGSLVRTALRASFRVTSNNSGAYVQTLALHRAVVDAIVSRREEDARDAMAAVLDQTARDLVQNVQSPSAPAAAGEARKPERKKSATLQGGRG